MSLPPEKGSLPPYDFGNVDTEGNFLDWPTSLAAAAEDQSSPLFVVPPGLSPSALMNSPGYLSPLPAELLQAEYQHSGQVSSEVSQSDKRTAKVARAMSWPPEKGLLPPYDFGKVDRQGNFLDWPPLPPQLESLSPVFVVPPVLMNSPGYLSPLPRPFWMSNATAQAQVSQAEYQHSGQVSSEVSQSDKTTAKVAFLEPVPDDCYQWRTHMQRQIKTTGRWKKYYNCAHVTCRVRKHVERFRDGRVSQIKYKGQHHHDPPKTVSSSQCQSESERLNESITVVDDQDPVEPIAKRISVEPGTGTKIVLQIKSEADVLDDGYKWIIYWKKPAKGNTNPRRYYRGAYTGCSVHKHVERASDDPESVIVEYEGKHNHDIPADKSTEQRNRFM